MNPIYRSVFIFSLLFGSISLGSVQGLAQDFSKIDTIDIRYHGIEDKAIIPLVVVANSGTYKNQQIGTFPAFTRMICVDREVLDLFAKSIDNYFDTNMCKSPVDTLGYHDGAFSVTRRIHNGSKKKNFLSANRCGRIFFSNMIFEMKKVQNSELLIDHLQKL